MKSAIFKSLLKRIFSSILVLILVVSLVFALIQFSPGKSSYKYISPKLSPEVVKSIMKDFKAEEGIFLRYVNFMQNFLTGNLGVSFNYRKPVLEIIFEFLPFTIFFGLVVFLIQLILSYLISYEIVRRKGSSLDKVIQKLTMSLYSTPIFLLALLLIYIFAYSLKLFPISGLSTFSFDKLVWYEKVLDILHHLFLPGLTLILALLPIYIRYFTSSIKQVLNSTFILNLKSLGAGNRVVFFKHLLPNSINPVLAVAGIDLGFLLSGSLIVEVIFGLPGMGRLSIQALLTNDYPLIIGCCLISGLLIILAGFISDLIRIANDKRLKLGLMN